MNRIFFFLVAFFMIANLLSQNVDMDKLKGYAPRSIGPAGMSGRVTSIDVELKNPSHIIIGTASGGIWESWNEGISWNPIFDEAPVQSIGALAMNQNNPDEIYVGTGEGNPRNSHSSGLGMFKTIDGGKNWESIGLEESHNIHRVIIHPSNSKIVYVGVLGSAWGKSEERGVYKTTDGGKTWKKTLYNNDETGCADLILDSKNPNKLFAAMWEFGRKPWTFNSGGVGSGLYVSFDGGDTWKRRTEKDGLPKGELGRIGLAQPKYKPNVLYALIESKKTGLYKSVDGGYKWNLVSTENIGNRPFYYADIYADPQNENRLYNLFSFVTKSEDGGKTFKGIAPYSKIHPDHHAFWIHPENPDFLIDGNDGGLNISKDGGKSWRYITNLPLGQFYHINIDDDKPYNIYGGLQDNGSWIGPSYVYEPKGIQNHHWQEVVFGDGFDVVPQRNNNRFGFAMYQGGHVQYYDKETGRTSSVQPIHPQDSVLRFNWNAAIAQDPFSDSAIYFGSQYVHYSKNLGLSWDIISPDLTTNDTSKQKQATSGGLTIDATRAENYTSILCIAPSPIDSNVIWVGTDDGNLQLTKDGGKSWTNLSSKLPGVSKGAWIPQIEVSKHIAGEAYVVVNDYRRNDWSPYLYKTIDFGQSWTRIIDDSKVTGHVWCVAQDLVERNLLFAGTEYGLYFSINGGAAWTKWTEGLPSVPVSDIKIQENEQDLVIGTFGRAVYVLDNISILRAMAKDEQILDRKFVAFESVNAYPHPWRTPRGIRFAGDANFRGKNRTGGAIFSLWIDPSLVATKNEKMGAKSTKEKKTSEDKTLVGSKTKKKKDDKKVKVVVYNSKGDSIRQFSFKADSMIIRKSWNLRENGVRNPQRKTLTEKQKKSDPPSGVAVLPGDYKLVFEFKGYLDSTNVSVRQHPKYFKSKRELQDRYDMGKAFEVEILSMTKTVNRLKEMKTTITNINSQLKYLPDSVADTIRARGKVISDSSNAILNLFFLKEGFKGYDHVTQNISTRIGKVRQYMYAENALENEGLTIAWQQLQREVEPIMKRVNQLSLNQWLDYRELIQNSTFEYFKNYDPLNYGR